jgi:uncharacterized protein YecE (DUF72 family)
LSSIRIGTSGYSYSWNQGKPNPFEWYVVQGFNSVEINASFYRFPPESWIRTWISAPENFTFSIKVHRSITHFHKLKGKSFELWKKFRKSLRSLENKGIIEFWLFQMPLTYKYNQENLRYVNTFLESVNLGNKAVVEFRDQLWWNGIDQVEYSGAVFCSVSAPTLPDKLISSNDVVYLRMHGSKEWYNSIYSEKELDSILSQLKKANAERKVIYLNNDHGMLKNGQYILRHL